VDTRPRAAARTETAVVPMTLEALVLFNFRNLANTTVRFSAGLNIIQGENGQGKTNLMEAIYLLGTTKSFRRSRTAQLVTEGCAACSLKGRLERNGRIDEFFFRIDEDGSKQFGRGEITEDLYDYIGSLDTLAFTGEHLSIVRGGPEERRKFIDRGIVGVRSAYLKTLVDYRRAIRQKNRFLSDSARGLAGKSDGFLIELQAWNERIIDLGSRILLERANHVSRLRGYLREIHAELFSGARPPVEMSMRTAIGDDGSIVGENLESVGARLQQELESSARREQERCLSLVGPHRDEIEFRYGGRLLRQFGSSGQQRGYLLAAKLGRAEIHREESGGYPVFLFDDFESELDRRGRTGFLHYCRDRFQLFIAVSAEELDMGEPWSRQKRFRVQEGRVSDHGGD
jgi:DNA replication and repair protein RecF